MEGISAVTARINEIRAMLHPPAAVGTPRAQQSSAVAADSAVARPSFADALAKAADRSDAPPVSAESRTAKHGNGRIPSGELASIDEGDHRLAPSAATAFRDLQAAARRDGVTIGVTDSYRSYDAQVDVARRKGLYSQGGLAAQPGTSQHGWGLAVDLDLDSGASAWMQANAVRFGFVEDTPREPWHWTFKN